MHFWNINQLHAVPSLKFGNILHFIFRIKEANKMYSLIRLNIKEWILANKLSVDLIHGRILIEN